MLSGLAQSIFLDIFCGLFVSQSAGHGLYTYQSLLLFAEKSVHALRFICTCAYQHTCSCLKPNTVKEPNNFSDDYIVAQLKCTGIMETIRIRQCGFPTRLTFEDFLKRYVVVGHSGSIMDFGWE